MRRLLPEAVVVAVVGALFALAANALSPRGLSLERNYFVGDTGPAIIPPGTNALDVLQQTVARLKAKGLQVADSNQVAQLFQDPRRQAELIVFVDSRDAEHYQAGHIPGAYPFDHYRPAEYIAAVMAASQAAETIVIYCNGGNCEDSEFAAVGLREAGISNEKILVYPGGMTDWASHGRPVETGVRNSGLLRQEQK